MTELPKKFSRPLLAGMLLSAFFMAGCPAPKAAKLFGTGMDMFSPVRMRVHPLTRLIPGQSKEPVEIHIEFTDQFGDVGKAVGALSVEIDRYAVALPGHRGQHVETWTIDLSTPQENRTYWDPITRTYTFKLPSQDVSVYKPGEKFVIVATMVLHNSAHLHDIATITVAKNSL